MIQIDMEMPRNCINCPLEYWSGESAVCAPLKQRIFVHRSVSRLPDCPLHPLDYEIRVGDEVCFNDGESFKGVVLDESVVNGAWCVLTENGCVSVFDEKKLHRTGRHFDEVETMLKKMRSEDDG